jgi:hypothetical protein
MLIARPCIAWLAMPARTMKWQGYVIYDTESICFPKSLLLTNHPMVSCR